MKIQKMWLKVVGHFYSNTSTIAQEALFGVLPADIYIGLKIVLKIEKILRYPPSHPL